MPRASGKPNPRSEYRTTKLRQQVGDRDGWVCYRCHLPIDRTLKYPHPMSASLEHIIPSGMVLREVADPYDPAQATVSHLDHNRRHGGGVGAQRAQGRNRWVNPAW